jgi:hypothetical protein
MSGPDPSILNTQFNAPTDAAAKAAAAAAYKERRINPVTGKPFELGDIFYLNGKKARFN